jgi:hypothetical protein
MFEVFSLGIITMVELEAQWRNWQPVPAPEDAPPLIRHMLSTKPAMPNPPEHFDRWPFQSWRTEVVRRADFIIEDLSITELRDKSNVQTATRPMEVPPAASAVCEVAAGILFTGSNGDRLLFGVDWMPMNMVISRDDSEIEEYLAQCERVNMTSYLSRLFAGGADAPPPK